MIAALLDSAMTQCLFAQGCQAFTAELTVRYRQPVAAADRLIIRAWLVDSRRPLHPYEGCQEGCLNLNAG